MHIALHKKFKKQLRKLRRGEQERCKERLRMFEHQRSNPLLNDHQLSGKLAAYRTINIGGDLRAQYEENEEGDCFFLKIGTHSELYE